MHPLTFCFPRRYQIIAKQLFQPRIFVFLLRLRFRQHCPSLCRRQLFQIHLSVVSEHPQALYFFFQRHNFVFDFLACIHNQSLFKFIDLPVKFGTFKIFIVVKIKNIIKIHNFTPLMYLSKYVTATAIAAHISAEKP